MPEMVYLFRDPNTGVKLIAQEDGFFLKLVSHHPVDFVRVCANLVCLPCLDEDIKRTVSDPVNQIRIRFRGKDFLILQDLSGIRCEELCFYMNFKPSFVPERFRYAHSITLLSSYGALPRPYWSI